MKKLVLLVGILMIASLGFASMASAQEASVFGNGVLIRAFVQCSSGCDSSATSMYSAFLEVRDEDGAILPIADFQVTGVLETSTPVVTANPFKIHDNDLITNEISMSYDSVTKIAYVFNTDTIDGMHVSKYDISVTTPVDGVCVTYSTGLTAEPTNLCLAGEPDDFAGSGPWSWICKGLNGGDDSGTCSAQLKVHGACGSSNGGTFATAPSTNLCSSGTASAVTSSGTWNWTCAGVYGGTTATCSASIETTGNNIDLALVFYSGPSSVTSSSPWTAKVVINNNSSNQARAFNVKFYCGSTLYGSVSVSAGLAGGASKTVYSTMYLNVGTHSWKTVTVVIEPNAADTDTNTSNDSGKRSVQGV